MNPREQVCHNRACWVYGEEGRGNIVIHSRTKHRYQCKRCGKTFSATKDTTFYRVHKPHALVVTVVTLLAHGCPVQAIVAAFGLDERTVADWQQRAGAQCQRVHGALVQAGQVHLGQVQADEVRVRAVGAVGERRAVWMAMALSVASRLWLGGVVSAVVSGEEVVQDGEDAGINLVQRAAAVVQPSPMTGRKDVTTDGTQHRAFIEQTRQEHPPDRGGVEPQSDDHFPCASRTR